MKLKVGDYIFHEHYYSAKGVPYFEIGKITRISQGEVCYIHVCTNAPFKVNTTFWLDSPFANNLKLYFPTKIFRLLYE